MRNAEYIPVAQIPMVDLSAQYEAAVARREEAELRKLQYLNQFQKTRGRLAEGVRPEVEKYWKEIQDSLDSGDMSFEAKKKRQELYNTYSNIAADALDWTRELDEREATILASPDKFKNPAELLSAIEEDRYRPLSSGAIQGELSALPSLSKFYRFKMKETTPGGTASTILDNLKKGGGLSKVYNQTTGAIDDARLDKLVADYFLANQFNQEEEDAMIVNALRAAGAIGETIEDAATIQNLSKADRASYLNEIATDTKEALRNLIASDITTEAEQEAKDLALYRAKAIIERKYGSSDKPAPVYNIFGGDVPLVEVAQSTKSGDKALKLQEGMANLAFHHPVSGDRPSYVEPSTNTKYTITNAGVTIDGKPVLIATYPVSMAGGKQKTASKTIPVTTEVLSSLSNAKATEAIAGAIEQMSVAYGELAKTPQGQKTIMEMWGQPNPDQVPGFITDEMAKRYQNLYGY
jgi:hypothetical protein